MKLHRVFCWVLLASALFTTPALAQHPGSAAHNQRVLPAHELANTKQPALSWGAFAASPNQWSGWTASAVSEESASLAAIENCASRGGFDCEVEFTFTNSCAVVATSSEKSFSAHGEALEIVRRKAFEGCGTGCTILREGCSYLGR